MHVEFALDGAIGFDDANDDDRNVFAKLKFALQLFESGFYRHVQRLLVTKGNRELAILKAKYRIFEDNSLLDRIIQLENSSTDKLGNKKTYLSHEILRRAKLELYGYDDKKD